MIYPLYLFYNLHFNSFKITNIINNIIIFIFLYLYYINIIIVVIIYIIVIIIT